MAYKFLHTMTEDCFGDRPTHFLDGLCSSDWKPEYEENATTFMFMDEYGHMIYAGLMTSDQWQDQNRYNEPLEKYGKSFTGAVYMEFCINGKWQVLDEETHIFVQAMDMIYDK